MNIDHILAAFNRHQVAYLLIGGVNFLLRHKPVLTYDVDFWIDDTSENLRCCEAALAELQAEWGPSETDWKPVASRPAGWLHAQSLFCLTSPHGAIDIFRSVRGLSQWSLSCRQAVDGRTAAGIPYKGLSDADMLACQLALDEGDRDQDRIRELRQAIEKQDD